MDDVIKNNFNIDESLALKKKLINENDVSNYTKLYFEYKKCLERYLDKVLGISVYDKKIDISRLYFEPVKKEQMDFYQFSSSFKYFFLRNNLYVERLDDKDIKIILGDDEEKKEKVIKSTFKVVIKEYLDEPNDTLIGDGTDDINLMYPNGGIALGFRYDEFSNESILKDNWKDNYNRQLDFIENLFASIQNDVYLNFDIPFKVMIFDRFNTKERKKNL